MTNYFLTLAYWVASWPASLFQILRLHGISFSFFIVPAQSLSQRTKEEILQATLPAPHEYNDWYIVVVDSPGANLFLIRRGCLAHRDHATELLDTARSIVIPS